MNSRAKSIKYLFQARISEYAPEIGQSVTLVVTYTLLFKVPYLNKKKRKPYKITMLSVRLSVCLSVCLSERHEIWSILARKIQFFEYLR